MDEVIKTIKNMYRIACNLMMLLFVISCTKKDNVLVEYKFKNESASFDIIYPLQMDNTKNSFIEIKNYKSEYDTIKKYKRYPILCLFIEDSIVDYNKNIMQITGDKALNFGEYYIYDEKFKIPSKLLKGKKGKYKLTIAVLDILARDTIKADPSVKGDEDKLDMEFLDTRTFHDIEIK